MNRHNFLRACEYGIVETVKKLLDESLVNAKSNRNGYTPLILASLNNNVDIVKLLIQFGCDIDEIDDKGNTALILASTRRHSDVINILLDNGANINHRNTKGETSLMLSHRDTLYKSVYYQDIIELLVIRGANFDICDNNGNTVFHQNFILEDPSLLIKNLKNINVKNQEGETPLMRAVLCGNHNLIELLINHGADISLKDLKNKNAMYMANGNSDLISIALLSGDYNFKDGKGHTLLKNACHRKDEKAILFLYERGADFNLKDNKGASAFDIFMTQHYSGKMASLQEKIILEKHIEEVDEQLVMNL